MASTYISGLIIERYYFKTGRSLIYISIFIFGAGIFLIEQMFNLNTNINILILYWILGIYPISLALKDNFIFIIINILALIYAFMNFNFDSSIFLSIVLLSSLYYFNRYFNYSLIATAITNFILVALTVNILDTLKLDEFFVISIIFLIGKFMYYHKFNINKTIFKIQGSIIFGISGVILSFKNIWDVFSYNYHILSIIFSIVFIIYLLHLTKKGDIISFTFVFIIILRYYFDTFYDFLPKSIFFFSGGLLLILFGYYLEKIRKKKGDIFDENK